MTDTLRTENSLAEARLQKLLLRFALAAQAHHAAMEALDAEQAEAQARILAGLHETIASLGEQGFAKLRQLVDSCDPVIAGMAAVYTIRLDSEHCLATLCRIAKEPGLLGFRAGIAVERWKSGEWNG